jgi:tmRNA-binding protein
MTILKEGWFTMEKEQTVWLIEITIQKYRDREIDLEECVRRIELLANTKTNS